MPLWSRDGRGLFYLEPAAPLPRLISVGVADGPTFSPRTRMRLLDWPFLAIGEGRTYDVSPDGRFLGIVEGASEGSATQQIIIVENWIEELKRLAPVD
jgi:hypothetical protein